MTATNAQVRIMMRERQKGKTQEQAAGWIRSSAIGSSASM